MECPVCNSGELDEAASTCPQCQSDIEVFRHLEEARKQYLFQKKSIAVLAVLLAISAAGWGFTRLFSGGKPQENAQPVIAENTAAPVPASVNPEDTELKKENEKLSAEVISLKTEVKSLNEKLSTKVISVSNRAITHVVKEGESLWKIAQKYYKDGNQYKKIADENGLSNPKSIRTGMKLKINK